MMKNTIYSWFGIALVLLFSLANWGCKKVTFNDAVPVVKMTSVKKLGIDSVVVTGTITANTGLDIQYEGFCYGTDPEPKITENQKLFENDSTTFSAHLYVNKDSIYNFRCFAANSFGFALSAPMK